MGGHRATVHGKCPRGPLGRCPTRPTRPGTPAPVDPRSNHPLCMDTPFGGNHRPRRSGVTRGHDDDVHSENRGADPRPDVCDARDSKGPRGGGEGPWSAQSVHTGRIRGASGCYSKGVGVWGLGVGVGACRRVPVCRCACGRVCARAVGGGGGGEWVGFEIGQKNMQIKKTRIKNAIGWGKECFHHRRVIPAFENRDCLAFMSCVLEQKPRELKIVCVHCSFIMTLHVYARMCTYVYIKIH